MSWLRRLLRPAALERELDQELRAHLEEHVRDLVAAGWSAAEARRRARLELGGVEQVKEDARDVRGTRWLVDWWQDTRYAIRAMRRSPGFTVAAVVTLAIGIGANTAVYSLVNALLLRPLPLVRPLELFVLQRVGLDRQGNDRFSYPLFTHLRDALTDSSRLAGMSSAGQMYASIGDAPEPVTAQLVSGGWFPLLGVRAAAGRLLGRGDDVTPGGSPVAVLSHGYWIRRFGANPAVIGSTIRLNGLPLTVVGVTEPGFFGLIVGQSVDVWLPTVMQHDVRYHYNASITDADESKPWITLDGVSWLTLVVRTAPAARGETAGRLDQSFRAEQAQKITAADSTVRQYRLRERVALESAARGLSPLRDAFSGPLVALMVAVGLVLLIACANLASLLLARSAARSHEVAVRVSLGAKPGRLVRQVLTESLTLALLGGAVSLLVARWGGPALVRAASSRPEGIPLVVGFDGRLLLFATLVSIVTGILFGLAPALRVSRGDLYQTFKTGGRVIGADPHRLPLGRALVVSQIALSLILVTGAGLFIRTLRNLLAVDPGFDREQVVAVRIDPRAGNYPVPQLPALYQRLVAAVGAVRGVTSVSMSLHTMATGSARTSGFYVPGQTHGPEWNSSSQETLVTPGFLATVGMALLRGRNLTDADGPNAPKVALINEAMAKHFFGDIDPIGKRFGYDESADIEVVGIVRDARINYLKDLPPPLVIRPIAQEPDEYLHGIEARVRGPAAQLMPTIRAAIHSVDQNLPIQEFATLGEYLRRGLQTQQFVSELVGLFSGLALLLAAIGLYGVMAYSVARRTNEIGIRLALGAAPRQVRWLVLGDTLKLVAGGLVIGVVLLLPSLGLVRGLVYGFSPRDPATLGVAILILLTAGVLAGTVPAWRAARVDPATALRAD